MIDEIGNLWKIHPEADARCITTNGSVKKDGAGVMGRGVAAQAARKWPGLPQYLGLCLSENGNVVQGLMRDFKPSGTGEWHLVAFPVKHEWHQDADIRLIVKSAQELSEMATREGWQVVVLPRPGCGNGNLMYHGVVRSAIKGILDDRFIVVDLG